MRTRVVFAAGLALLVIAIVLVLNQGPLRAHATNGMSTHVTLTQTATSAHAYTASISACQAGETVPQGTTAIRLSLVGNIGTPVTLQVLAGKQVLTHGSRDGGWTGASVLVPVQRLAHTATAAKICFTLGPGQGSVIMLGKYTRAAIAAHSGSQSLGGRMRIDYMQPGPGTWFSHIGAVAFHIGLGRTGGGTWIAFLLLALMMTAAGLMSWLTIKELP